MSEAHQRCLVCGRDLLPYRVATVADRAATPKGDAVTPTGPLYFPSHGCAGDHQPVGK